MVILKAYDHNTANTFYLGMKIELFFYVHVLLYILFLCLLLTTALLLAPFSSSFTYTLPLPTIRFFFIHI